MNDAVNALGRHEVVPPAAAAPPHPSVEGVNPTKRSRIWGISPGSSDGHHHPEPQGNDGSWWNQHAAHLRVACQPINRFTCAWARCDDPALLCLCPSKNPAIADRVIVSLGDESRAVSPIHKATPTATVAPGTASVPPAATVAPSTSIAGIREATTSSTAISPATSATVTPSSELKRLVQL